MLPGSKTDGNYRNDNSNIIKVDFGVVPVGSNHKRSIEIKNDSKKTTTFRVKNNNECMYLADSIYFEPSRTPPVLPNKKTTFSIRFSPKSAQTTLEYFSIFPFDDKRIEIDERHDDDDDERKDETVQKITVRVQGSCDGPTVKIVPTKVFMYQSGEDKQNTKCVNLINSSDVPGQYHVQYDWANCPLKCSPSSGIVKNQVQIKLELKPIQIGYYFKRLYVLIAYHHPVCVDVYVLSSSEMAVDPFSCFRTPFKLPPKREHNNDYAKFFDDVVVASEQPVSVFPKELHFGYANNAKTMSFDVRNNSDSMLFVNWINALGSGDNAFAISPKQFYVGGRETKTLECVFRPKATSNIYFAELEATVHFGQTAAAGSECTAALEISSQPTYYVIPMNVSITATGHSFKKSFNGWKPKCKLSSRVIVMPPCMPASGPVFATVVIKKIVRVPMTFEFRPPDKSIFLVKPKCGLINGDFQVVVFKLLNTDSKESIYAERWALVFDGFENDSMTLEIYASVEFGCALIGDKNHVLVQDDVQIGHEIETHVPIVNTTRHRLKYYIKMYDQRPAVSTMKSDYSWSSSMRDHDEYGEELETEETNETECDIESEGAKSSLTSNNSAIMSMESTLNVLKNSDAENPPNHRQSPFAFKFNKVTGELKPNEKVYLKLSFGPVKSVGYTVDAKCYLISNEFPKIVNILPVVIRGNGCETRLEITPTICNLNDVMVNTKRTQQFTIKNTNCSYANIKVVTMPACSTVCWPIPACKINPETFQFTPEKNYCKIDLCMQPTKLGFQKFFVNIQRECKVKCDTKNENIITVCMNVISCALNISRISNDTIPYFGKLTLNKLFNCVKMNDELSTAYNENNPSLTWTIPVVSESTVYEFQLYNLSKKPIDWTLKYNTCIECTLENNDKKKNRNTVNTTVSNKCEHYKSIQISTTKNLKIELNNINTEGIKLSYNLIIGNNKLPLSKTELILEPTVVTNDLISFDPKYGINGHLEFSFAPIYIAHPSPPAQAFWVYNNNECSMNYSIIDDDSSTPAYPYFQCFNSSGIVNPKSIHPLLFVFTPDRLCTFEATVVLLSNNNRRQITLVGQGESFTRTHVSPGPGSSTISQTYNDKTIFLSTECILLKPIFTFSNIRSVFCLYNNSDEEIMYEWKECTVEKILIATIIPLRGNLKRNSSQVFEITVTSHGQPAILTIMFNVSYKLVSQNDNYKQSLKNYQINKDKLDGVFIINERGNYKPKLNMKIYDKPQEKNLVLYVQVKINNKFNSKWINEAKNDLVWHTSQQRQQQIMKQKIQNSDNFLWAIVDQICSKKIKSKPLYYYQLKNSEQNIPKEILKLAKNNLDIILTAFIKDNLINVYPSDMWKN